MATDPDIYLKEDQLARELLLRQTVDVDEQVVPIALQEMEMTSTVQVCDPVRPSEVLREESVQKVADLQPIRECLGEILALQAAVETSLSEINNKGAVSPVVSKKSEVKGTPGNVAVEATISRAVGASLDAEKKLPTPEVVVSTKDGKPNIVVHSERKSYDRKAFRPSIAEKPASFQTPTDDQLTTRANMSRKSDRQQSPGNTTVIVKSRDSLTTYSGSNLSLWLLLGNDSEPDRIIAKQTRRGSHRSQRPPRGYDLITETKYRGSSSSNAPNSDTERTHRSSGTNEAARKRKDEDEDECLAAAVRAVCDRTPSANTNQDGLKGTNRTEEVYSVDVRTPEVKRSVGHSAAASPIVSAINAPQQQLLSSAVTEQQSKTHQDILSSSVNSHHQLGQDSALSAAMLLSSNEALADPNSLPNHAETYKSTTVDNTSYYHILSTSPNDFGVDDSQCIPVIFAVPTSEVESISSAFSAVTKEHSASDINRSRHELGVLFTPTPDSDAQQSIKPNASSHNRTTQAETHQQGTDASSFSADGTNASRYSKSAGKVTCPEGGIQLHLCSGILRSSPSSGTNDFDDIELIRRLSEMGTGSNAVLHEPDERKECQQKTPQGDPVFTSSSRFCFISDETIRRLSSILDSAMQMTAAFKQLDAAATSPAPTARPSEVTVTDTAKSTVYSEEEMAAATSNSPAVEQHNARQVKIIKPMPFGRATGGVRPPPDPVASGMKPGRGMSARHPGMAYQNARIISDSIREYHRKMKANAEFPEETPRALKIAEQYCFPELPRAGRAAAAAKPNATTESGAISSTHEQQSTKALPEETVSQTAVAAGVGGGGGGAVAEGASVDLSSPSATSVTIPPKVKASTTMTTESGAVTCCPKTSLVEQDPSLDLRRCECQAHHRHAPQDDKQQDGGGGGSSTEEDGSSKEEEEAATAEGLHQRLHSTDAGALTTTSGDPSNDLRPSEADTAAGTDGVPLAVDGVAAASSSVESTGIELELPTDHSTAPTGLE